MSLNDSSITLNESVHIDDPGYAADLEESLHFEFPREKCYRQRNSTSSVSSEESSTDSERTQSIDRGVAKSRCTSPIKDRCVGLNARLKTMELTEQMAAPRPPTIWHSNIHRRFNRTFNKDRVQQDAPVHRRVIRITAPRNAGWQVDQHGRTVGWFQMSPPEQETYQLVNDLSNRSSQCVWCTAGLCRVHQGD